MSRVTTIAFRRKSAKLRGVKPLGALRWLTFAGLGVAGCGSFLDLDPVNDDPRGASGSAGRRPSSEGGTDGAGAADGTGEGGEPVTGGTDAGAGSNQGGSSGGSPPGSAGAPDPGSAGGAGVPECDPGFGDCTSAPGCETPLDSKTDCGECGRACAAAAICRAQAASPSCEQPGNALDGQRWEVPCLTPTPEHGDTCGNYAMACPATGYPSQPRQIAFGGEPGTLYDVVLRIAGAVEPKIYTGGMPQDDHFYIAGVPTTTTYNSYTVSVSNPPSVYHLNFDDGVGESVVMLILDHQKTIPIAGGATVTLTSADSDCRSIRNCVDFAAADCVPHRLPGVAPVAGTAGGQVLQLNVVSVTPRAERAAR